MDRNGSRCAGSLGAKILATAWNSVRFALSRAGDPNSPEMAIFKQTSNTLQLTTLWTATVCLSPGSALRPSASHPASRSDRWRALESHPCLATSEDAFRLSLAQHTDQTHYG